MFYFYQSFVGSLLILRYLVLMVAKQRSWYLLDLNAVRDIEKTLIRLIDDSSEKLVLNNCRESFFTETASTILQLVVFKG